MKSKDLCPGQRAPILFGFVAIISLVMAYATVAADLFAPARTSGAGAAKEEPQRVLAQLGASRGWCAVLGETTGSFSVALAQASDWHVFVQTPTENQANTVREAAEAAGLLGSRLFVQHGPWTRLHLADNLMNAVIVRENSRSVATSEIMRVLQPGGKWLSGNRQVTKPFPKGTDDWSHPYHGPDNNPQSADTLARAPYLTHFAAEPWYSPMPLVTVAAGGRLFKAFGHIAVKEREWPWLNSLVAQDAFNGTLLWKRPLSEGFMVHRNTLIATPTTLYVADDRSCKLIDAATGEVMDEIIVPAELAAEPSWKWMALMDDTLYALVGRGEEPDPTVKGERKARGWPWGGTALGEGYNRKTYPWGFGHTLLAIDPSSKNVRWRHREESPLDSRGICLAAGRLFFYSQGQYVGALDVRDGKPLWKSSNPDLLSAIGENRFAQNPNEGFSSSAFVKANDRALYFAGPTRNNLVAVAADDGRLLWQAAGRGNSQLVLRNEGLYAMSPRQSTLFDFVTGKVVKPLGPRVNCTRATGSADSIFVRGGSDGTMRYDLEADKMQHLGPMRPSCQDGVLVAYGHLFWGPWMCDCNLTLVGVVSLAPAGDFDFNAPAKEADALERASANPRTVVSAMSATDWPTLRANNQRNAFSSAAVPHSTALSWTYTPTSAMAATAPVAAYGLIFAGGKDGAVRALDVATGKPRWVAYTGGAILQAPTLWEGRLYAGSTDGWVYAWDAANGRRLWRFRVAPAERMIPIYGSLSSTWPVASGVLVDNGVLYASAGIANHDGTHVYALDARDGSLRWHNGSSGSLNPRTGAGVSVNGHLLMRDGFLYLAGGNTVPVACYDSQNGQCRSEPKAPQSHTQFRAGGDLFVGGDDVSASGFPLYSTRGDYRLAGPAVLSNPAGTVRANFGPHDSKISFEDTPADSTTESKAKWTRQVVNRLYALAVTPSLLIVTGTHDPTGADQSESASVMALDLKDGEIVWRHALPAAPVSWGLAIDRAGRVLVTLQDGRVVCYSAS